MALLQKPEDALFRAAVELAAGTVRQAFLDQARAGDPAFRQRLAALLAAVQVNLESGARQVRLWRAPSWAEIHAAEAKDKAEIKWP